MAASFQKKPSLLAGGGSVAPFLFLLLMFNLMASLSAWGQQQTQEINFCGIHTQPGGSTSGGQGPVILDRFGNAYSLEEMLWQQSKGQMNCSAGIFQMNFIGNFPADEEATICQAFQDLSVLVAGSSTVQVPINIVQEPMSYGGVNNNVLATGSDFFVGQCGLLNSSVLQLIRTGENNLPVGVGAGVVHVKINPSPTTTWFSLQDEQTAPINNTQYDLYSVVMHEALHILGFASRIGLNGNSISGTNLYSDWDRFLTAGITSVRLLLPNSSSGTCCNEYSFNTAGFPNMPQPLSGGCGINAQFTEGTNNVAPVNSVGVNPMNNGEIANKLSHLDTSCGTENYVMHPGIAAGVTRRTVTAAERQILCQLGYNTATCEQNCTVVAQDDQLSQFIVQTGQGANNPITVPFATLLANDAIPAGGAILTLLPNCGFLAGIQVLQQASSFLITGLTPGSWTFCYSLTGCDGTVCDEASVTVTVIEKLINTETCDQVCNMISYGDFEQFPPSISAYHSLINVSYFSIIGSANTVDIMTLGETGSHVLSWLNYDGAAGGNAELPLIPLCEPLQPGCTAKVSYRASVAKLDPSITTGSSISLYGLTGPPCPLITEPICPGQMQLCANVESFCMDNQFFPLDFVAGNPIFFSVDLLPRVFEYTNTGTQPITHFLIYGAVNQAPGFEGDRHRFFLDDLVITNSCIPQIAIAHTVSQQCINGQAVIEYQVCLENPPPNQSVPVQVQANVPVLPGVSIVPGGGFDANGMANITLPDQDGDPNCAILTLTLDIGGNIQPGTELTVGMDGASPNACFNLEQNPDVLLHLDVCDPSPQACPCPPGGTVFNIGNNPDSETHASQTGLAAAVHILNNVCISMSGRLIWDIEGLINASHIIMNEGAEIVVDDGSVLYLNDNLIEGCNHMWRGLTADAGGKLGLEGNRVFDAQYSVKAVDKAVVRAVDNTFNRDYVGLYVPPLAGQVQTVTDLGITGNDFTCTATLKAPYAGQSPAPGQITYAAVVLNDVAGIDIGANNEADGIINGVLAFRSAFTMDSCTVKNLIGSTNGGTERFAAFVENCEQATVTNNVFDQVGAGIHAYNSNLTADDNQITGYAVNTPNYYDYGIQYSVGNNRSVRVRDNVIKAWDGGIDISECQSPTILRVKRNEVEMFPVDFNNGLFPGPAIVLNACNNGYVYNNQVTNNGANSWGSGIFMNDCRSLVVVNNTSTDMSVGFDIGGGAFNYFVGNDAISSNGPASAANGRGFNVQNSADDQYCGNYTDGQNGEGWSFFGACTPSVLKCNRIDHASTGLYLWADNTDPAALLSTLIGVQINRGNKWLGAPYPSFGAFNATVDQDAIDESRFRMPASDIPSWSTGLGQNTPTPWFGNFGDPPVSCLAACPIPYDLDEDFPGGGGGGSGVGDGMAVPDIGSDDAKTARGEHNGAGINWMSRQRLYERLQQNPSLAALDPDVQAFFSQMPGTALGQLYAVKQQTSHLLSRNAYTQYCFGELQGDMAALLSSLHELRVAGPGNSPDLWKAQIRNLQNQLAGAVRLYYRYEAWMSEQRQTGTAAVAAANAAVNPPNVCAENEKSLNALRTANGFFLAQTAPAPALQSVKAIADQCPIEGGLAVYEARSIYHRYRPEARWDDYALCGGVQQHSQAGTVRTSFAVVPNPADDVLSVLAAAQLEQDVRFDLYRTTGGLAASLPIAEGSVLASLPTADLPPGVYFYRLTQQGAVLQTGKVVIAH